MINLQTSKLRVKACYNEPIFFFEVNIDQRIKDTLGITGLWILKVPIKEFVWHLDVGSSHPGGAESAKGLAVRQLKWYVSWV